ncbi:MAG: galactokinase [Ruminococcaceae bacterium]|nr:galactokinase [Oscillospiraceae bacterium]
MNFEKAKENVAKGLYNSFFAEKSGIPSDRIFEYKKKLTWLLKRFEEHFGEASERNVHLITVGGRSEISGNHTDHNCGKVIAASVGLSVLAVVCPRDDGIIRLKSHGFDEDRLTVGDIGEPDAENFFSSVSLIAGTVKGFEKRGLKVGGFDAYTTSDVLKGSGLSSSAAFEVTVGKILSVLYNEDNVSNIELAKIAQFAENVYFGKPCGLMDQAACAVGGLITVDFENTKEPVVEKLDFSPTDMGYSLCIIDTGGCHADLNDEYASVTREMKAVASALGKEVLRGTDEEEVLGNLSLLREKCGDRAILRALHFFEENKRVDKIVAACKDKNIDSFLKNITASGNSSFKYLQNLYPPKAPNEQGLPLALFLTEKFIAENGNKGACRVHGGGFAGTVQAFIPTELKDTYKEHIEKAFGEGSCYVLNIRSEGATDFTERF